VGIAIFKTQTNKNTFIYFRTRYNAKFKQ